MGSLEGDSYDSVRAAPAATRWRKKLEDDGTLRLELSFWGMLCAWRRPLLGWLAVSVVLTVTLTAAILSLIGHLDEHVDAFIGAVLCAALLLPITLAFLLGHVAMCSPRAIHIGPKRWRATIGWFGSTRAEGNTRDLVVQSCKRKTSHLLCFFPRIWCHVLHLREAGTTGRLSFWQVLQTSSDFADMDWLAQTIRRHVLQCAAAAKPLLPPGKCDEPCDPVLPATSRWSVHKTGDHCRVELPQTAWSEIRPELWGWLVYSLIVSVHGASLLNIPAQGDDSAPVLLWMGWSYLIGSGIVALFVGAAALRDMSPRVLEVGPEVYTVEVGWPWLIFKRRSGKTSRLHVQEMRLYHRLIDKDIADDQDVRYFMQVLEDGVPGRVSFWTPWLKPFKAGTFDFNFRAELTCLVAIITRHVQAIKGSAANQVLVDGV